MAVQEKNLESYVDDVQGAIDQLDFATMDLESARREIDKLLGVVQVAIEETVDEETGNVDLSKLDHDAVSKAVEEMADKVSWLAAMATEVAGFADDVECEIENLKSQI